MVGTYQVIVAGISVGVSLATLLVCLRQRIFFRYFILNFYLLASAIFTVGCLYLIHAQQYGYKSPEYFYFYYTGDALFSTLGYILVASFSAYMFRHSMFRPYVRPTLAIFFFLVVGASALFIARNVDQIYSRFVIELQQNMFFVGVLLTFLLWLSMSYLGAESRRFALLVSGLGIYFSAHAASYALLFLGKQRVEFLTTSVIPPLAYTIMVSLWLYTFLRVPEGEPARVRVRLREAPMQARF